MRTICYSLFFGVLFSPCLLFASGHSVEGSFLLRNTALQIQDPVVKNFSTYSQFLLKSEFQPSNKLKTQVYFLSSQHYGELLSLNDLVQLYPSVSWLLSDNVELQLGRNFYKNNSPSFSTNSYESSWYSLDGLLLSYTSSLLEFDFWSAHLPERWVAHQKQREFDYGFGFFLHIDMDSFYIDSLHFEVSYLGDSFLDQNADKMSRYGFNIKGTLTDLDLDYHFFFVGHSPGLEFKLEENMSHGELHYKRTDFFNSVFSIGYHTDSSDYNPWLYNRHKQAGRSDFLQWRNLNYYFVQTSFFPFEKLAVEMMFLNFNSNSRGEVDLGYFGSVVHGLEQLLVEKGDLGQELNVKLLSQINQQIEVQFLTAFFIPQSQALSKKHFFNNMQLSAFYKF